MKKYLTITILLLIYTGSAYINYQDIRTAHSKGGRFEHSDTSIGDLMWTFLPVFNTVAAGCILTEGVHVNTNSFYGIQK